MILHLLLLLDPASAQTSTSHSPFPSPPHSSAHCHTDTDSPTFDVGSVELLKTLRGESGRAVLNWTRGYFSSPKFAPEEEAVVEYSHSISRFVAPGALCFLLTLLTALCCCLSRLCPGCCCEPKHPLNEYSFKDKARPEAAYFSCWVIVLTFCVLGIVGFADIGHGLKQMSCGTETFLTDASRFFTGLNDELSAIVEMGVSSLEDVSAAFSGGIAGISNQKNAILAELQAFVNYINGLEVNGQQLSLDSGVSGAQMVQTVTGAVGGAVTTLTNLQGTVDSAIVTPKTAMMQATEVAAAGTSAMVTLLTETHTRLTNDTLTPPAIPVVGGLFFSEEQYSGVSHLLADVEKNIWFFGGLFYGAILAGFPVMTLGVLLMHFKSKNHPKLQCIDHDAAVCTGRFGCLFVFLGMLLCFLFSAVFLGSSAMTSDICLVLEDFGRNTTAYTHSMHRMGNQASPRCGDGQCNLDETHASCAADCFCADSVCHSTDENMQTCSQDCASATMPDLDPGAALNACFTGENLVDAVGLNVYFESLLRSQFDTMMAQVKSMNIEAAFQSSAYSSFSDAVGRINEASFNFNVDLYDKLHAACNSGPGGGRFLNAAVAASLTSSQRTLAATCDSSSGSTSGCMDSTGNAGSLEIIFCIARNTMAQYRTGCTDPTKTSQGSCTGTWDHDKSSGTSNVNRAWINANIATLAAAVQAEWAQVANAYNVLQAAAVAFRNNLVSSADTNGDGKPDGAIVRLNPFLERVGSLDEFTYCNFVKAEFDVLNASVCGSILKGMVNTTMCLWLAAFFCFFVIDSMFFLEIRLGGVGQHSHPALKHVMFKQRGGPPSDLPAHKGNPNVHLLMIHREACRAAGPQPLRDIGPIISTKIEAVDDDMMREVIKALDQEHKMSVDEHEYRNAHKYHQMLSTMISGIPPHDDLEPGGVPNSDHEEAMRHPKHWRRSMAIRHGNPSTIMAHIGVLRPGEEKDGSGDIRTTANPLAKYVKTIAAVGNGGRTKKKKTHLKKMLSRQSTIEVLVEAGVKSVRMEEIGEIHRSLRKSQQKARMKPAGRWRR